MPGAPSLIRLYRRGGFYVAEAAGLSCTDTVKALAIARLKSDAKRAGIAVECSAEREDRLLNLWLREAAI